MFYVQIRITFTLRLVLYKCKTKSVVILKVSLVLNLSIAWGVIHTLYLLIGMQDVCPFGLYIHITTLLKEQSFCYLHNIVKFNHEFITYKQVKKNDEPFTLTEPINDQIFREQHT